MFVCFNIFFLQPSGLPVELLKAAVIIRNRLTALPHRSSDADLMVLSDLAAVCRHWWKTMAATSHVCRQQLQRNFHCESMEKFVIFIHECKLNAIIPDVACDAICGSCAFML